MSFQSVLTRLMLGEFFLIVLAGCGNRTLSLQLPKEGPVRLIVFHENATTTTVDSNEVVLWPDAPICQHLREWLAQNQNGWSQSVASAPGRGIAVRAGDLRLEYEDGMVFTWTENGQFQKSIPREQYAFLKNAAGIGRTFGFVPDEATAIRIAITVWEPIYGKENIESERPFMATLVKGVWYVMDDGGHIVVGGSAQASIRQEDGKVLQISHAF
jgi:hypothetical protein